MAGVGQTAGLSEYKRYFDGDLRLWTSSFRGFGLSEFRQQDSVAFGKAVVKKIGELGKFLAVYKPLLTYTPDRTQFIDLYSGQLSITKVGNHYEGNADDGGEVFLCNQKKGYWVGVGYNSPGGWMEEAVWVSDSKFVLAGISKNEKGQNQPLVVVGDVVRGMLYRYVSMNKACVQTKGYQSPKLKRMNVRGI